MLWLALALVIGQAIVAVAVLLVVRSFGQYVKALVRATTFEQAIHEENRTILLKLLKLDAPRVTPDLHAPYTPTSQRESA